MPVDPQVVGGLFLLTGGISLTFLRYSLPNLDKPGSYGFTVTIVGIAVWSLSLGVAKFVGSYTGTALWFNVVLLGVEVATVGWFLLAVGFTGVRRVTPKVAAVVAGPVVPLQVLIWTNPLHHFVLGPETALDGGVLATVYGPGFWIHSVFSYLLVVAGTGLLVADAAQSTGVRRRQSALLALAAVPPILASVVTVADLAFAPYDVTPFGYLVSEFLFVWALYGNQFLEIVPVARRTAMAEMDDAVITLDAENQVVNCNAAARDVFRADEDYVGTPARAFFGSVPAEIAERLEDTRNLETEITTTIEGERRHFSVSTSPLDVERGGGRVIVFRDVTERKHREQTLAAREEELDLLRQVLTRVLRHNIRNGLTTISCNADLIATSAEGETARRAETIATASDKLEELSRKARRIGDIVERGDATVTHDLNQVVADAVAAVSESYPAVEFTVDGPAPCRVNACVGLEAAVLNLVENAAEHNDSDTPRVTITFGETGDGVLLSVADNGSGIPDQELDAIEQATETPLEHGSGIGLWLVSWVVDHSAATIDFETGPAGTTVTISFEGTEQDRPSTYSVPDGDTGVPVG
jgi:signal transduction histidine kinase